MASNEKSHISETHMEESFSVHEVEGVGQGSGILHFYFNFGTRYIYLCYHDKTNG